MSIGIVPSILSADFTRLGEQVREAEAAGCARIQVDVMDGHFVPNITMGPLIVEAVRRSCTVPIEAHLMIAQPERYVADFAQAGADVIIVHLEAAPHLHRLLQQFKGLGKQAGVALNPATPALLLDGVWELLDLVLVMTVNPGFGGQAFIPATLPKLAGLRRLITERGLACDLEVDGGIGPQTIALAAQAGANLAVAGSAVFNQTRAIRENIKQLKDLS
ncbi:MAG: ribulose-phosphate 3-epimerase [Anaerolineae bacterium]